MHTKLLVVGIVLFTALTVFTQTANTSIDTRVNEVVASKIKLGDPGVAVAVIKDGKVISKSVAGNANLDYNLPVSFQTSFNIASNAKQFTAVTILLMEKDGLLSLDDDFRKYTPDILKNYPGKITIRNLVNHTSGIRDVYDLWALQGKTWWEIFIGNDDALNLLKGQTDLNFKPGTRYLYSNSNYLILAGIVKSLTKQSLKDYAAKRIFEPLGMKGTVFADNYMQVIPNRADGYGNWNGWKKYPWITNVYGDGALFTTLEDQIKWEQHLADPKLWDRAFNDRILQPLVTEGQSFYGFGVMFENYKGIKHNYHDGSTGAYNASFVRFPSEKVSVIVMSNNAQIWTRGLALELAETAIGKEKFTEPDYNLGETTETEAKNQRDITGDYQFEDGTIVQIKRDEKGLQREIYGRDPARLRQISSSIYAYGNNDALRMKFEFQGWGVNSLTIYAPSQQPQTAVKLTPLEITTSYYAAINGKYYNAETDTTIEIKHKEGSDYNLNKNGRTRIGKLIRKDYLRMNAYQILIERNARGETVGLRINNNRIINVIFKKVD